jgi:L-fuconolactonase
MIDSHQHFWNFNEREYGWIKPEMSTLRADFGPVQLRAECDAAGIRGVVSVQARTTTAETEALLSHANENDFILGVVGWVDLTASDVGGQLDQYARDPLLRGIREICQGAPDGQYFENLAFHRGIAELRSRHLTYDILIYANQIRAAAAFVDRHPEQPFVVDHCAKPSIRRDEFPHDWAVELGNLSRRGNVFCKLSGLMTEIRHDNGKRDVNLLRPYFDVVLNAFGPTRLMFGSDWPVCRLATTYLEWVAACKTLIAALSRDEQTAIMGDTARRFYQLQSEPC